MENLINILLEQTKILKDGFIKKTEEWAIAEHKDATLRRLWKEKEWCEFLGLPTSTRKLYNNEEYQSFPPNFYNSKDCLKYYRERDKAISIARYSLNDYTTKAVVGAVEYYEASIEKLAARILKKKLNTNNLTLSTEQSINKNSVTINTMISDGEKTLYARAIIASGAIQKPHYRYIIS